MSLPQTHTPHFETLGHFEELLNVKTGKVIGTRRVAVADRPYGYEGRTEYTLIAPIELLRGHKTVIVRASVKKPIHVRSMLQRLCGRTIE
jgi:hypothetical protein